MHDHMSVVKALDGTALPAVVVDLDAFDRNVDRHLTALAGRGTPLRIATKSLRVPALIRRVLDRGGEIVRGLLCYSAREAVALHVRGFRDLLVAYPVVDPAELDAIAATGDITLAVDSVAGVGRVAAAGVRAGRPVPVVLDLDMSYEILHLHLGVRRSALRTPAQAVALARHIAASSGAVLVGLLAYEAQVAGLADRGLGIRWFKRASMNDVARRRRTIADALRQDGHTLSILNGGGVGSLDVTTAETGVNEIASGSGFYKPHLFDHYRSPFVRSLEPACFFALPVTRVAPGFVTCQGGGYVASGPIGDDRGPIPVAPEGLRLLRSEGVGEVQTPLAVPHDSPLGLGDPVLFRHAKAGEIMEHFSEVLLVSGGRIVDRVATYRGDFR
jgi:D-serine deaminase-like pyridoxal phosphate-dependent protein